MQYDDKVVDAPPQKFPPTKVLFIRNLPSDTMKQDIIELMQQFGKIEKVLILLQKSHAFV